MGNEPVSGEGIISYERIYREFEFPPVIQVDDFGRANIHPFWLEFEKAQTLIGCDQHILYPADRKQEICHDCEPGDTYIGLCSLKKVLNFKVISGIPFVAAKQRKQGTIINPNDLERAVYNY